MTQSSLGGALREQGSRSRSTEGIRLLIESAQAYHATLKVSTQAKAPQDWAETQSSLGAVLQEWGSRTEGAAGIKLLSESVDAFTNSLEVFTWNNMPRDWARTQSNLGIVFRKKGSRINGPKGLALLSKSIQAYRSALEVYKQETMPNEWATVQNDIGAVLQQLGTRMAKREGTRQLWEALVAYQASRKVFTREEFPQEWLAVRINEGGLLLILDKFEQAAIVFLEILEVDPTQTHTWRKLLNLLQNELFAFSGALKTVILWLQSEGSDSLASLYWIECLFTNGQPEIGLKLTSSVEEKNAKDPQIKFMGLSYNLANLLALDRPTEARDALESLANQVTAFPSDFEPTWTYIGTRHYVENTPDLPNREALRLLFEALEAPNREAILEGLEKVRQVMKEERLEEQKEAA